MTLIKYYNALPLPLGTGGCAFKSSIENILKKEREDGK